MTHVAIDDHARIVLPALYPNATPRFCALFFGAVLACFRHLEIFFRAVLTDNGVSYRFYAFAEQCKTRLKRRHARL